MASASGSKGLSLCHLGDCPLVPRHPGVLLSDPWHGDRVPQQCWQVTAGGWSWGWTLAVLLGRWDLSGLQKAGEPQSWWGPSWIQGGKVGAFPFTSPSL